MPQRADSLDIAMDHRIALEHHPTQLLILLACLDLQGCVRVALDVAHLLGGRICPRPNPGSVRHPPAPGWSDS